MLLVDPEDENAVDGAASEPKAVDRLRGSAFPRRPRCPVGMHEDRPHADAAQGRDGAFVGKARDLVEEMSVWRRHETAGAVSSSESPA